LGDSPKTPNPQSPIPNSWIKYRIICYDLLLF
jgi:hypothetical protein